MARTIDRRMFVATVGAGAAALALPRFAWPAPQPRRPNIVIIIADDLGYGDLGVQGCHDVPTPNIDVIAQSGIRFTNGYVSCPVCSPTRAGFQTGRYQQRFGHEFNPGPAQMADPNFGLALNEVTIADRLKAAGYTTGLIGKWHLGYTPAYHPMKRGYDEFFGFLGGAHPYVLNARGGDILRGPDPVEERQYLTDAFGRESVSFIQRHKRDPFLLVTPFNAVHMPAQATPKYLSRFPQIVDPTRKTLAAKLSALDDNVGRITGALREADLERDTLVFFFSDNGGPTRQNGSRNDPLRGYKGQVLEGGIRIPFMVKWPGRVPAGQVSDTPVISLDIHPTCLAAAGATAPIAANRPLDGVNLLPYLRGENAGAPHECLFWRYGVQSAVRKGDYKLVQVDQDRALFNLSDDIIENVNLLKREPDKVKELQAEFDGWNRQLMAPRWGAAGRRARRGQPDPAAE